MRRALLALLAILVLVPAAAALAGWWFLDEAALKARAIAAVQRATGRELTIAGPLRLGWALSPTIEARDVGLANPPGMSRPQMVHAEAVEAKLSLLPLLSGRIEVRRVALVRPDMLLERDATGRGNWVFAVSPAVSPDAAPAPAPNGPRFTVVVDGIEAEGGTIGWRALEATTAVSISHLVVSPASGRVEGSLAYNGVPLALTGTAGPMGNPVPLDLVLSGGGARATITGASNAAQVTVAVPDLQAVSALAGRPLPAVRDVTLTAALTPAGLTGLRVQAGAAPLPGGISLTALTATAAAPNQPVSVDATLALGGLPVSATLSAANAMALSRPGPQSVTIALAAGGATLTAAGTLDPAAKGFDLAVSARVPDLERLAAMAGYAAPPLRDLALDSRTVGSAGGVLLRGMRIALPGSDLAGDLAVGWQTRPSVRGTLVSQRLDLDTLLKPAVPVAAAAAPVAASATAPPAPKPDRVLPDIALPFPVLRRADADLQLTAAEIVWHGVSARTVAARLLLAEGKLRLDPLTMQLPGGPAQGQVLADASADPPSLSLLLRAPGLTAAPVLGLLGAPEDTAGTIDLDAQLAGRGAGLRALAASLDGHLGLAMVDGEVDNRWLSDLLAEALRAADIPLDPKGRSHVRCLALRADATAGQVSVRALALDTTKLKLEGDGGLNLGTEALDLHLRPQLLVGNTGVAVPLRLRGTLRAPKPALDAGVLAPGRVGLVIGGPPPPDACGPALTLARDGRPGPMPAAQADAGPPAKIRPADLLRSLLR